MPIHTTKLRKAEKMFTKQDYLDGKCTKDGLPISKGAPIEPEPTPTESPEPIPTEASNPTPQVESAEESEPVNPTHEESDSDDSENEGEE